MKTSLFRLIAGCVFLISVAHAAVPGPNLTAKELAQGFRDDRILAKPRSTLRSAADAEETRQGLRVRRRFNRFGDLRVLELSGAERVHEAIVRLRASGLYEYVEADLLRNPSATPSDTSFSEQWSLRNTGQSGGTVGGDIGATAAWDTITDASSVIVAVLDTGVRQTHVDIASNLWTSSTGTHGINAILATSSSNYTNPEDDGAHGSHVSGIIGAVGNNSAGISGVAWKAKIMALKFLPATGGGSTSDMIECLDFAIANQAKIINASFGGPGFQQSEFDAFARVRDAGIIVVAAAGNDLVNIDVTPDYPAAYALDNIVSVAATTRNDVLDATYSSYGPGSVDLAAPGTDILSLSNASDTAYISRQGTSMAAPHVTGALALLKAKFPNDTYRQLINRLLRATTKLPSLSGKVQSGGRLNIGQAVASTDNRPFNDDFASRAVLSGPNVHVRSSNVGATAEAEPAHASNAAAHSLWWTWTAPDTTQVFFDTAGSSYDTVLALYTGTSLASLTPVMSNDNNGSATTSRIVLNATAGTTYQIAVDGKGGASGYTSLKVGAVPPNDDFAHAKILTGLNIRESSTTLNASAEAGEPKPYSFAAGHTIWYKWRAPATGRFSLAVFATAIDSIVSVYQGTSVSGLTTIAKNDNNADSTNSDALVSFNATAGSDYYFEIDNTSDSSSSVDGGDFTLTLTDSVWEFPALDEITSSPAVGSDGTIYFGAGAGTDSAHDTRVYAVTSTGTQRWAFTTATTSLGVVGASPAIAADGTVYIGSDDKSLYALDGTTGVKKWNYVAGTRITSTPAVSTSGAIYFRDDTTLYALTATGALKWSLVLNTTTAGGTYASPVLGSDGTIYIGTSGGSLYALTDNGTSVSTKWTYTADGDIYTSPAIGGDGTLYFGTLNGSFYALTPGSTAATKLWSITLPRYNGSSNSVTSSPAIGADGTLYFAAYDHNLYALNAANGATRWTYTLGNEVRASSPAIAADGTVFVGTYDGSVYAINARGELVRTYPSARQIRSSPVIANNRLYFGSADAKLHAFDLGQSALSSSWPMFHQNQRRTGEATGGTVVISAQPQARNVVAGSPFTLSVTASSSGSLSYQWYKDGAPVSGATDSSYSVATATAGDAGSYTVVITGTGGSVTSSAARVALVSSVPGRLVNLSVRANAGAGDQTLIAGFVVEGSGSKDVLIRGVGPTLASFGVTNAVADPRLILYRSNPGGAAATELARNDNWGAELSASFSAVGATAFLANSKDAALLSSVTAGAHSAFVVTDTNGVALAEIYDTDANAGPRLINISGRAPVSGGSGALIAGFVISGQSDKTILVRGIGPKLGMVGVSGALSDAKLELYEVVNGTPVLRFSNDNWEVGNSSPATLNSTFAAVGAFSLDAGSKDAALLLTLAPGVYSAQVTGVDGATGVALVEVYDVP